MDGCDAGQTAVKNEIKTVYALTSGQTSPHLSRPHFEFQLQTGSSTSHARSWCSGMTHSRPCGGAASCPAKVRRGRRRGYEFRRTPCSLQQFMQRVPNRRGARDRRAAQSFKFECPTPTDHEAGDPAVTFAHLQQRPTPLCSIQTCTHQTSPHTHEHSVLSSHPALADLEADDPAVTFAQLAPTLLQHLCPAPIFPPQFSKAA